MAKSRRGAKAITALAKLETQYQVGQIRASLPRTKRTTRAKTALNPAARLRAKLNATVFKETMTLTKVQLDDLRQRLGLIAQFGAIVTNSSDRTAAEIGERIQTYADTLHRRLEGFGTKTYRGKAAIEYQRHLKAVAHR